MSTITRQVLVALTFVRRGVVRSCGIALLSIAPAAHPSDAMANDSLEILHAESTFRLKDLSQSKELVDDALIRPFNTLDNAAGKAGQFVEAISTLGAEVARKTNGYVDNPSDESAAEVRRVINEAAARGKEESDALAKGMDAAGKTIQFLSKRLVGDKTGVEQDAQQVNRFSGKCEAVVGDLEVKMRKVAKYLDEKGVTDAADLPPEFRKNLQLLRIDYEEAKDLQAIWSSASTAMAEYIEELEYASTQLSEMGSVVEQFAYAARSFSRRFENIGAAEVAVIRTELLTSKYRHAGLILGNLKNSRGKLDGLQVHMRNIIGEASRVRPKSVGAPGRQDAIDGVELINFFKTVGGE